MKLRLILASGLALSAFWAWGSASAGRVIVLPYTVATSPTVSTTTTQPQDDRRYNRHPDDEEQDGHHKPPHKPPPPKPGRS
jgi:hypothetical protein